MRMPVWRGMTAADLPAVDRIAAIVHPGYPERPVVMAERLRLFPEGCLVAAVPGEDTLVGYAISHPARPGVPPALDSLLKGLSGQESVLHLHDIALLPEARRGGLGGRGVRRLVAVAEAAGLAGLTLIAVADAAPYWARLGFRDAAPAEAGEGALASYGGTSRYMAAPTAVVAAAL